MKNKIKLLTILLLMNNYMQAQERETIEAKFYGKPIVQIMLNGVKTWMLLDTGAGVTILDITMQDKYDFKTYQNDDARLNIPGFGSSDNQLKTTSNAKLAFGKKELQGAVYAYDLSTVSKSIHDRTGKRIAGIIGIRMMRTHGFIIDMGRNTASITIRKKKVKRIKILKEEDLIANANYMTNHKL